MPPTGYETTARSIAQIVRDYVPDDATPLLASGGDDQLLSVHPRAREFPEPAATRAREASGLAAIAHLEAQRAKGADFLLVPERELWRLDEDTAFNRHLRQRYRLLADEDDVAMLFALRAGRPEETTIWEDLRRLVADCERELDRDPVILDWRTGHGLRAQFPDVRIFSPLADGPALPYPDETIDVVALSASAIAPEIAEARRIASLAIVRLPQVSNGPTSRSSIEVEWKSTGHAGAERGAVIVPCLGPSESVSELLFSLRETLSGFEIEIVLAHEPTPGEALPSLQEWAGVDQRVRLLEVPHGAPAATACNAAASSCDGEILVFVAPVACPLPGWLHPLLRTFRDRPDAGAVGAKVLTFHGELLHAGGELLADGSSHAVGLRGDPNSPLYSCVRAVDFTSPALFATPRDAYTALGGFGGEAGPGPFLDYCARLGGKGYGVYYQPEAATVLFDRSEQAAASQFNGRPRSRGDTTEAR